MLPSREAKDVYELGKNISLPQETLGPQRDCETRKEIQKAIRSWINDGVFEGCPSYRQWGLALRCETQWLACPGFLPTPYSHLPSFAVYIWFLVRADNIYILSCYHNSPSCFAFVLFLHGFNAHHCISVFTIVYSLLEFFILICSLVGWFHCQVTSFRKGPECLFPLFSHIWDDLPFAFLLEQLGWV